MRRRLAAVLMSVVAFALPLLPAVAGERPTLATYHAATGDDAWTGGVRMIPIHTRHGDFRVWTKRVGHNPRIKVLLLHGGPGPRSAASLISLAIAARCG